MQTDNTHVGVMVYSSRVEALEGNLNLEALQLTVPQISCPVALHTQADCTRSEVEEAA